MARRADRLAELATETGAIPVTVDVTDDEAVAGLLAEVVAGGGIDTLINIAGGARGADFVGAAKNEDWDFMLQVNVMGTMKLTRAFLPMLRANGEGTVLNLTSTAAQVSYEGGGGYNAAKAAQRALTKALRLEEAEYNVRVIEVLPGLVHTEEFSLLRFGGNAEAADAIYKGVEKPLVASDVAEVIAYSVNLPHHINLDEIVIRPVAQAAAHKLIRKTS